MASKFSKIMISKYLSWAVMYKCEFMEALCMETIATDGNCQTIWSWKGLILDSDWKSVKDNLNWRLRACTVSLVNVVKSTEIRVTERHWHRSQDNPASWLQASTAMAMRSTLF
jgi:hypothetical protein